MSLHGGEGEGGESAAARRAGTRGVGMGREAGLPW